ncbi:MAG: hypothetical protein AAGB51_11435 [Planctomycetota bacterium]
MHDLNRFIWTSRALAGVMLVLLALTPGISRAQDAGGGAPSGPFALGVADFGLGNRLVPGRWNPIRLVFSWSGDSAIDVLLRVAVPDADGDVANYERVVAVTPGLEQSAWLYALIPGTVGPGDGLTVSAFRAEAQGRDYVPGDPLAEQFTVAQRFDSRSAVRIGVVGRSAMGLARYTTPPPTGTSPSDGFNPLGHGAIDVVTQLTLANLPDRAHGFDSISTLVFAGENPAGLRLSQAQAIGTWVRRGGHLIVVLPTFGEQWTAQASNPLFDLMPRVAVERLEAFNYNRLRAMLTKRDAALLPRSGVVQTLTPLANADASEARPVLVTPTGDPIVTARHVGAGTVTLVGIDLPSSSLASAGLPDADVFWNRVLGRRGRAATGAELDEESRAQGTNYSRALSLQLDGEIGELIAEEGTAAQGVLLGFVLFVIYWLVAGPVGYAILRKMKLDRHAWLAFAASAGLFTVLAWGGAVLLRPASVGGSHFSMLSRVAGQDEIRVRSWVSLLVPRYGSARVEAVGEQALLAPWESAEGASASFPDTRSYSMDAADPREAIVPVRQTVKQFRIDQGGLTGWSGMPRALPDAEPGLTTRVGAGPYELEGTLIHELPGALREVNVIVCRGQVAHGRALASGRSGEFIANAGAFGMPANFEWQPGDALDLSAVTSAVAPVPVLSELLGVLTPRGSGNEFGNVPLQVDPTLENRMLAILLYGHLDPPTPRRGRRAEEIVTLRSDTAGMGLSRWLTEPCVIVFGILDQDEPVEPPALIEVDGEPVRLRGQTVVSWVYPLPPAPPGYREDRSREAQ